MPAVEDIVVCVYIHVRTFIEVILGNFNTNSLLTEVAAAELAIRPGLIGELLKSRAAKSLQSSALTAKAMAPDK